MSSLTNSLHQIPVSSKITNALDHLVDTAIERQVRDPSLKNRTLVVLTKTLFVLGNTVNLVAIAVEAVASGVIATLSLTAHRLTGCKSLALQKFTLQSLSYFVHTTSTPFTIYSMLFHKLPARPDLSTLSKHSQYGSSAASIHRIFSPAFNSVAKREANFTNASGNQLFIVWLNNLIPAMNTAMKSSAVKNSEFEKVLVLKLFELLLKEKQYEKTSSLDPDTIDQVKNEWDRAIDICPKEIHPSIIQRGLDRFTATLNAGNSLTAAQFLEMAKNGSGIFEENHTPSTEARVAIPKSSLPAQEARETHTVTSESIPLPTVPTASAIASRPPSPAPTESPITDSPPASEEAASAIPSRPPSPPATESPMAGGTAVSEQTAISTASRPPSPAPAESPITDSPPASEEAASAIPSRPPSPAATESLITGSIFVSETSVSTVSAAHTTTPRFSDLIPPASVLSATFRLDAIDIYVDTLKRLVKIAIDKAYAEMPHLFCSIQRDHSGTLIVDTRSIDVKTAEGKNNINANSCKPALANYLQYLVIVLNTMRYVGLGDRETKISHIRRELARLNEKEKRLVISKLILAERADPEINQLSALRKSKVNEIAQGILTLASVMTARTVSANNASLKTAFEEAYQHNLGAIRTA